MTRLVRVLVLAAALWFMGQQAEAAAPSSGLPAGPVGSPVVSAKEFTAESDVLIVGDSITVRGYKDLAATLPGKQLAVNAQSGRNTRLSIDSLFQQIQAGMKLPPVLIMAVGANDIFASSSMAGQVKRLLAEVAGSTRVYWVDVSVVRPAYRLADTWNSAMVNAAIRRYCTGSCSVISWAGFLAAKSSRRAMYLDSGGVHPNVAGAKAWATLIAGALR